MNFKRETIIFLSLLVLLNLILRIPWTPHEIGWDTFAIYALTNSISTFGQANWWVSPLSIIGMSPYSENSAVPFFLSGLSQTTGLNVDLATLTYSLTLGILTIIFAYLMAGVIWDNDIFKFLVAFVFSTSEGIVTFTTWNGSTRTLFVVMLPLLIYLLLKTRHFKMRGSILTLIFFILLVTIHKIVFFTVPALIGYLAVIIIYGLRKHIRGIKIPENFINVGVLAGFLFMFLIPFFYRGFMEELPRGYGGSRYEFLMTSFLFGYIRYVGVLIVFIAGGLIYLSFKKNKSFEEWFLLLTLMGTTPLVYIVTYMKNVIPAFSSLLIAIALTNVANIKTKKKHASLLLIIILTFSIVFTGYFQFLHVYRDSDRYMDESTNIGALWIKDNVDKNMVGNNQLTAERIFSISEVRTLTGYGPADLSYGLTSIDELNIIENSPFSLEFYRNGAYVKRPNTPGTGYYLSKINEVELNSRHGKRIISKFDFRYVIEDKDKNINMFIRSVRQERNSLYDNGRIRVWDL